MKKCQICQQERPQTDFYGGDTCYKCVFGQKMKDTKTQVVTKIVCIICSSDIPSTRSKFCSKKCQKEHNDKQNKQIWWKRITIVSVVRNSGWT